MVILITEIKVECFKFLFWSYIFLNFLYSIDPFRMLPSWILNRAYLTWLVNLTWFIFSISVFISLIFGLRATPGCVQGLLRTHNSHLEAEEVYKGPWIQPRLHLWALHTLVCSSSHLSKLAIQTWIIFWLLYLLTCI